ncbi:hypothetical protein B4119_2403 [Parageobacillus caldoxylosilyticus]|uniref:Uncharacterized protein n=1 Tax=Saccharococcus caldoxylosilyticus TaxID=81408 RepID=A0A150LG10_9BACL|nr:hypothetical protein B4119_2403 [Parageobacillus caldoxylosilyticus]
MISKKDQTRKSKTIVNQTAKQTMFGGFLHIEHVAGHTNNR